MSLSFLRQSQPLELAEGRPPGLQCNLLVALDIEASLAGGYLASQLEILKAPPK